MAEMSEPTVGACMNETTEVGPDDWLVNSNRDRAAFQMQSTPVKAASMMLATPFMLVAPEKLSPEMADRAAPLTW